MNALKKRMKKIIKKCNNLKQNYDHILLYCHYDSKKEIFSISIPRSSYSFKCQDDIRFTVFLYLIEESNLKFNSIESILDLLEFQIEKDKSNG